VAGEVQIGTSGWHYKHWRGVFYPQELPSTKWLDYYSQRFHTVEINNSFYRLPSEAAFDAWRDSTPAEFRFAVKGSRYLTHMKKLKEPDAGLQKFLPRAQRLGAKLGVVLFQLPPFWEVSVERLEAFLQALPRAVRYTFELRNPSWHTAEVYRILQRYNAAYCIYELAGFQTGLEITADFTYIRLHGPGSKYKGSYEEAALEQWAKRINSWRNDLQAIFVYFDNDEAAYAAFNALALKTKVEGVSSHSHALSSLHPPH
jgi:uncharacterized protein YecE (DUF72 family)